MEYKVPKVLERSPEVMGFDLAKIGVGIGCGMGALFTILNNLWACLCFVAIGCTYFYITKKFPGKGELLQFVNYNLGTKCIRFNTTIASLTNKRTHEE
ncbi:hypothetical protein FGM00_11285 [Aggregatimonas sangjinii]|uniref:Uncharacterized protein n=1 Tax=Aggregatimonas sangjinii TaxID=2583587 RepID=A0A5B7SV02_9FLAO|nr:hypothetical protein [Aggregatimonas sangjinii]QCX00660.1 hypothetical protein FGM00_11285 [Aggregatimonas sangjinii]